MSDITPEQLKKRLVAGDSIAVVDIRESDAYEDWHIDGSTNLPVYDALKAGNDGALEARLDELPRDRPIVAVCNVGRTSKLAVDVLRRHGLDAVSLAGGIRGWSLVHTEAPLSLRSAPNATVIQVRRNGKGCLSYILIDGGSAVVVDPAVSATVYLDIARRNGATITHVLETHVHADHISRAGDLARQAGATLHLPANDRVTFEYEPLRDGDALTVGDLTIRVIATPGHTGESVCYRINDELLLTGDTLFTDSVGRPDLEKGDAGTEPGAEALYQSLHEKLLDLPDHVRIAPAHTAGEIGFDGTPIVATLGDLRKRIALLTAPRDQFTEAVLAGLTEKPPSFTEIIAINEGRDDLAGRSAVDLEAGPNRCAVRSGS